MTTFELLVDGETLTVTFDETEQEQIIRVKKGEEDITYQLTEHQRKRVGDEVALRLPGFVKALMDHLEEQ